MIQPPPTATAIAEPETVELGDLEQATVKYSAERSGTDLHFWAVAVSKRTQSTYRVKIDDSTKYGPSRFPPTDLDDKSVVWMPPERAESSITVEVSNLANDGTTREYHILPLGWETTQ